MQVGCCRSVCWPGSMMGPGFMQGVAICDLDVFVSTPLIKKAICSQNAPKMEDLMCNLMQPPSLTADGRCAKNNVMPCVVCPMENEIWTLHLNKNSNLFKIRIKPEGGCMGGQSHPQVGLNTRGRTNAIMSSIDHMTAARHRSFSESHTAQTQAGPRLGLQLLQDQQSTQHPPVKPRGYTILLANSGRPTGFRRTASRWTRTASSDVYT